MKMHKQYSSFEQIEKDLKILKLKKEIDVLTCKQQLGNLKEALSFSSIALNFLSSVKNGFLLRRKQWYILAAEYALSYIFRKKR